MNTRTNYEKLMCKIGCKEQEAPLKEIAKVMVSGRECPVGISEDRCKENLLNYHLYPWGCLKCWEDWLNQEVEE